MLDANSYGHAAPETKTINVEANLLSERLGEREKHIEAARRRLLLIFLTLIVGLAALPPLYRMEARAHKSAVAAKTRADEMGAVLTQVMHEEQGVRPKLATEELRIRVQKQTQELLGHMYLVMNAVTKSIVLGSLKAEVVSGDIKISGGADAESYGDARAFISTAGEGPNVQDMVLSSTRRSDALGNNGVAFDFIKRVKVGS